MCNKSHVLIPSGRPPRQQHHTKMTSALVWKENKYPPDFRHCYNSVNASGKQNLQIGFITIIRVGEISYYGSSTNRINTAAHAIRQRQPNKHGAKCSSCGLFSYSCQGLPSWMNYKYLFRKGFLEGPFKIDHWNERFGSVPRPLRPLHHLFTINHLCSMFT